MNTVTVIIVLVGLLGLAGLIWGPALLARFRPRPTAPSAEPPPGPRLVEPDVLQLHRPPTSRTTPASETPVDEQLLCLHCGKPLPDGCMSLHRGGIIVSCPHCGDRYPLDEGE